MIDWTKPIEAVHDDGRVAGVALDRTRRQPDRDGDYSMANRGPEGCGRDVYRTDGSSWSNGPWRIRNVDTTAQELTQLRAFKEAALASGYVPAEPVDGDLLEAREIYRLALEDCGYFNITGNGLIEEGIAKGNHDSSPAVRRALSAIRAARGVDKP